MAKWQGKYIIGLTGNIGTGKSVVRKMLEHLGVYGIDADAISHRIIAKGAPGYQPVVNMFGQWIVGADGQIDRRRLGKVVFSDPEALVLLEKIIHPYVHQGIDWLVQHSTQPYVAIEAIKLLESDLYKQCDSIWVVDTPQDIQIARLVRKRGMPEAEARQRIAAQPSVQQKIAAAQVVIQNGSSYEDTWKQVSAAWQRITGKAAETGTTQPIRRVAIPQGELVVRRAKPREANDIADLFNRTHIRTKPVNREDIMAIFGEKALLLLQIENVVVGSAGWQVENLVARTTDLVFDPQLSVKQALPVLINEMEKLSKDLQSEASLIFAPSALALEDGIWKSLGYETKTPANLSIQAWQEAAEECMTDGVTLFFKKLRQDRVLRPI